MLSDSFVTQTHEVLLHVYAGSRCCCCGELPPYSSLLYYAAACQLSVLLSVEDTSPSLQACHMFPTDALSAKSLGNMLNSGQVKIKRK